MSVVIITQKDATTMGNWILTFWCKVVSLSSKTEKSYGLINSWLSITYPEERNP